MQKIKEELALIAGGESSVLIAEFVQRALKQPVGHTKVLWNMRRD